MSFGQKCVVFLLGIAILGGSGYFARIAFRPPELERFQSIPWVKYVHPNEKRLKEAQDLARDGKLKEAQDVLIKALLISPKSPVTRDLRDLLGYINTQIFFSNQPSPRKTEYIVKSGDTLAAIARNFDSSAEAIMHVNNLDSTLIRLGQKLQVPRLDFAITIDLPDNRLIVHDSGGFFSQYPIVSTHLPRTRRSAIEAKVAAKSFWKDGKAVQADQGMQKEGTPRIDLGQPGYVLYSVGEERQASTSEVAFPTDDNEQTTDSRGANRPPPQGIAIMKEDIADIALLIRKGTPVTIVLKQKEDPDGEDNE
ncbi:MAG: LysM peptidoglycan-binding domain-containing protein [Verrucomicrobia bacterium]|nr:LysM peptidoglycan-binding domain-containing protein [Verrucomicrobiota bacterium]